MELIIQFSLPSINFNSNKMGPFLKIKKMIGLAIRNVNLVYYNTTGNVLH